MSFFASLYNPNNPSHSLKIAYIVALTIIAFLTVLGHYTTYYIMTKQEESTDLTYHISRMRGMAQRIPYHIENYANYMNELERSVLSQSAKEFSDSYDVALSHITGPNRVSDNLNKIFFNSRFQIDDNIKKFYALIDQCLKQGIDSEQADKTCFIVVEKLDAGVSSSIVNGLGFALETYRIETVNKIKVYHIIHLVSMLIILVVLVLEAFFIFKPLIRKNAHYFKLLIKQAMEDHLTKLKNRRAFSKSFTSLIKRQARTDDYIAVALMDLDKFKSINDTYGHDVGDKVLVHFSKVLRKCLRAGDISGRIGGEEFAVVLDNCSDQEEAYNALERIREAVETLPCEYKDQNGKPKYLKFTVSIGLLYTKAKEETADTLFIKADEILYKAKETGRNKVVISAIE